MHKKRMPCIEYAKHPFVNEKIIYSAAEEDSLLLESALEELLSELLSELVLSSELTEEDSALKEEGAAVLSGAGVGVGMVSAKLSIVKLSYMGPCFTSTLSI